MAQHYSDPKRAADPYALPDVETFYRPNAKSCTLCEEEPFLEGTNRTTCENCGSDIVETPGWYWWVCLPGCLPDSDPKGPFKTEIEAVEDAWDDGYGGEDQEEDL